MKPWMLPAVGMGLLVLLVASALIAQAMQQQAQLSARLRLARGGGGLAGPPPVQLDMRALLARFGEFVAGSGLLSARTVDDLRQTLRVAGLMQGSGLGMFIGGKLLLMAGLPLLVVLLFRLTGIEPPSMLACIAVAGGIGLMAPDLVVRRLRKKYIKALERGLPDALDMLIICCQAGLGLETGLLRVAEEIGAAHRAVADELFQTVREMQVNADIRAALLHLGARTGLPSLKRLAAVLIQSMQYGTPLSNALRTLSAEERGEMLARFEAREARLPVLLTLPMIVFILPCVFMTVGGPAIVQVMQTMGK